MKILLFTLNIFVLLMMGLPSYASDDTQSLGSNHTKTQDVIMPVLPSHPTDPEVRGSRQKTDASNNNANFDAYSVSANFASGTVLIGTLFIKDKSFIIPGRCMIDGKDFRVNYADVASIVFLSWKPKQTKKSGSYVFYPERARVVLFDGSEYVTTHTSPFYSFRMEANKRSFTVFSFFYCDKRNGKWFFDKEQVISPNSNPHEKTLSSISFQKGNSGVGFDAGDFLKFLLR